MFKKTNIIFAALIYVAFFGLVGFAVWLTSSATPLWALLLLPTIRFSDSNENEEEKK